MSERLEQEHVHAVYEKIASHFSQTRYKPWPIVEQFISRRELGSVGIDVGCGNGKYIGLRDGIFIIGTDRSSGLVNCAKERMDGPLTIGCNDVGVADGIGLPHPYRRFDFALSIAVVHHFSTRERRVEAIASILKRLIDGGELLVYVWALEQKSSRRGWDENSDQDVFVPWVLKSGEVANRYYHLYRSGELRDDIVSAGGIVIEEGYERDNWWAVAKSRS
ncbi:S-adenosyl-L-methionine-dependent methyltransferase [Dipodascopsis uninucleata]